MRLLAVAVVTALLSPATALAGRCDGWLRKAESAKGEELVQAYKKLAQCDEDLARTELHRYTVKATELDTLVALAIEGIRHDAFNDLWKTMDKLSYDLHAPLAEGVGKACADEPKVLTMLQGAYVALKGSEFSAWQPALASCGSEPLVAWMDSVVLDPPKSEYNAKYNAMLTAWVSLRKADALPTLQKAAVAAADGGPLNNVLEMMQRAIQPESMRDKADPADEEALAAALVAVANEVGPEPARLVADRLYTAGREAQAASLLPRVYPDRVQGDGGVLWAAAAVEQCDGKAVVHWTQFTQNPPTHWSIQGLVEEPLRGVKAKLKCDAGEWPVRAAPAPFADGKAAKDWASELATEVGASGDKVKLSEEKGLL